MFLEPLLFLLLLLAENEYLVLLDLFLNFCYLRFARLDLLFKVGELNLFALTALAKHTLGKERLVLL